MTSPWHKHEVDMIRTNTPLHLDPSPQKRVDRLPKEVLKRYEKWKDIVRISGPPGLCLIKGFHDEALRGQWKGHGSSRLGVQYRVIYKVEERSIQVLVVDVTPHDYRSKS